MNRPERGATAVVVALVLVMLLGFTALAVDLGAAWSTKKQLQNGADASALAIAQACANGDCGATAAAANSYADSNRVGAATGSVVDLNVGAGTVTTEAQGTQEFWFAPVLGLSGSDQITARATAVWGRPVSGATLPITLSWCDWSSQTGLDHLTGSQGVPVGGSITLPLVGFKNKDPKCNRGAHNEIPGGFGFLNDHNCVATITSLGVTTGYTGNTTKGDCTDASWEKLRDTTVVLPLFDQATRDDAACDSSVKQCSITYVITGFAAIHITGYCLPTSKGGHVGWNVSKCNGNSFGVTGKFESYADLDTGLQLGNPSEHFGAAVVRLSG